MGVNGASEVGNHRFLTRSQRETAAAASGDPECKSGVFGLATSAYFAYFGAGASWRQGWTGSKLARRM